MLNNQKHNMNKFQSFGVWFGEIGIFDLDVWTFFGATLKITLIARGAYISG
jgi:hypothetical protein